MIFIGRPNTHVVKTRIGVVGFDDCSQYPDGFRLLENEVENSLLIRPAPIPIIEASQVRVIPREAHRRRGRANKNSQPVAPNGQIRSGMGSGEKCHFMNTIKQIGRGGGCFGLALSQCS